MASCGEHLDDPSSVHVYPSAVDAGEPKDSISQRSTVLGPELESAIERAIFLRDSQKERNEEQPLNRTIINHTINSISQPR